MSRPRPGSKPDVPDGHTSRRGSEYRRNAAIASPAAISSSSSGTGTSATCGLNCAVIAGLHCSNSRSGTASGAQQASSLETDWNDALRAVQNAQDDYDKATAAAMTILTQKDKTRIRALAADFPGVSTTPSHISPSLAGAARPMDGHVSARRDRQGTDCSRSARLRPIRTWPLLRPRSPAARTTGVRTAGVAVTELAVAADNRSTCCRPAPALAGTRQARRRMAAVGPVPLP